MRPELADHPAPWTRGELHALRGKNEWIGKKKLLQLPIHMLGAQDMESKILGSYTAWVAKNHPDAPTPAHRATPYGALHGFLGAEADPDRAGSLAARMVRAGQLLGIEVR